MNTPQQAETEVADIIQAGLELAQEAVDIVSFFENYVVSAKDASGHEVFEETGGVDGSFEPLLDKVKEFKRKINEFAGEKVTDVD
jgi:hypothetical protein